MTLRLTQVGYRYAGSSSAAILDVDLELRPGEVVGLTGASESGKTTLCLVASGLAPRAIGGRVRGRIELDGEDVDAWPMHRLGRHVAIGFESPASQLSQVAETVFEEVAFGPMNLALPLDEVLERTWTSLESLRIAELADRHPTRLSGGQQQLVAIAGLLAMRPEHLVLDEPTAQLDPAGTGLVTAALVRLADAGASILLAEQRTDVLAALAMRVVVLSGGRVALEGPAAEVLADSRLAELGVTAPTRVRLTEAAATVGVDPARLAEAMPSA